MIIYTKNIFFLERIKNNKINHNSKDLLSYYLINIFNEYEVI